MKVELLFIGGDADGQRFSVESNLRSYRIPKKVEFPSVDGSKYARHPEEVLRYDEYEIVRFADGNEVMVVTTMTIAQAITALIESYRPGRAFSGQWQRGIAPFMGGEQSPGVIVEMANEEIQEMQSRGAQFNEATVVFHPISKE